VSRLSAITPERLEKSFESVRDWETRYRLIIDLGKRLDELPEEDRTEANYVEGCQSQVWLKADTSAGDGLLHFSAWSDAHLVRGLIAILIILFDGRKPEEVLAFDIEGFFNGHGLGEHLTPGRSNGFFAMVSRIRGHAAAMTGAQD